GKFCFGAATLIFQNPNVTCLDSVDKGGFYLFVAGSANCACLLTSARYLAQRGCYSLSKRRATSRAFSRLLKAETRKYPSPWAPKPAPGVITTFKSRSMRSNICQLVRPSGGFTQMEGAAMPPKHVMPALATASRRILALPM